MTDPTFETFPSWAAVLAFVDGGGRLYYHAPLSVRPVAVPARVEGNVVRIMVSVRTHDCDPFGADEGHLSRMKRKV